MVYKRNEITREKEKIMGIRTRLAVLACKTSNAVLRRMGRGGTNLPGKIALKIDKDILKELSRGVKTGKSGSRIITWGEGYGSDRNQWKDDHVPYDRAGI